MRKLIALVFHYSLNGLLADEGTDYYRFCFELLDEAGGASDDDESLDFLQGAHAHVMGRTAYEGMATSLPAHPDSPDKFDIPPDPAAPAEKPYGN